MSPADDTSALHRFALRRQDAADRLDTLADVAAGVQAEYLLPLARADVIP